MQSKHHKTVEHKEFSRHHKARIAEAATLFRLCLHGLTVFGAVFDGERTDWLVETANGVKKLQVKWVRTGNKGERYIKLQCTEGHRKARRYKEGEFDFVVGYDLYTDTAYVWSWKEASHRKSAIGINKTAEERWDKLQH